MYCYCAIIFCIKVAESVDECKKKWRLIRDKYVRELRKVKDIKSGDAGPSYTSCWPHFASLAFLQDTVRHGK